MREMWCFKKKKTDLNMVFKFAKQRNFVKDVIDNRYPDLELISFKYFTDRLHLVFTINVYIPMHMCVLSYHSLSTT